jgi:hypothetical protein
MDTRRAFLNTSRTLLQAFIELAHYRIVGNTASIAILSVHERDKDQYDAADLPAIEAIRMVGPREFHSFGLLFDESSMIIAYSWLDTFLAELEETLFLHDPASLGESVQVKLGKVLSSGSIHELVHDIAKRRTREKGQWGLKNRITDLKCHHKLRFKTTEYELEWISDLRNNLIHNRRIGEYKTEKGKLRYEQTERKQINDRDLVQRFLSLVFQLLAELYTEGSKAIGITGRFAQHRFNLKLIASFNKPWSANHSSQPH